MGKRNNSDLFYTCSLIEFIRRKKKRRRDEAAEFLGMDAIERIYEFSDVFHCEPIEKVAEEFIDEYKIAEGGFDNAADCRYIIPDYWTIGEVYERLIEDCYEETDIVKGIWEVYHSWINDKISDYNTDFYYQARDYIMKCYKAGTVL